MLGIFNELDFRSPHAFRDWLADEDNRRAAHSSLRRYLAQGTHLIQAQDGSIRPISAPIFDRKTGSVQAMLKSEELPQGAQLVAMAPPLYNRAEGYHGQGETEGYFRAAIAPGDVGGAAAGGAGNQDRPFVSWTPVPGVDQQWKNIFSRRPSTSDGERYEGAVAIFLYKEIKLGDKPEFAIIEDTNEFVKNVKQGAACNVFQDWIDDNKVWDINRLLEAGRRDALRRQAYLAYKALKDMSFHTETAADTSWVKAINQGMSYLKDLGSIGDGQTPVILCSTLQSYIFTQLKHDRASFLLTGNQCDDFDVISTKYFSSSDAPRMVVPGLNMWWQDRQPVVQDSARDIFLDAQATTFDFRGNWLLMANKGLDEDTGRIEATASLKQGVKLAITSA